MSTCTHTHDNLRLRLTFCNRFSVTVFRLVVNRPCMHLNSPVMSVILSFVLTLVLAYFLRAVHNCYKKASPHLLWCVFHDSLCTLITFLRLRETVFAAGLLFTFTHTTLVSGVGWKPELRYNRNCRTKSLNSSQ